jgi:hypothetical protein
MTGDPQIPNLKPGINPDDLVSPNRKEPSRFVIAVATGLLAFLLVLGLGIIIVAGPHINTSWYLNTGGFCVKWNSDHLTPKHWGHTTVSSNYRYNGIQQSHLSDAELALLSRLINVTEVSLPGADDLNDDSLDYLAKLSKLTRLDLSSIRSPSDGSKLGPHITDVGIAKLVQCQGLQEICLAGCDITDQGVKVLATMKSLKVIDLSETKITDAGLGELKSLVNLKVLILEDTQISSRALQRLKIALPGLTDVFISGPNARGATALPGMP